MLTVTDVREASLRTDQQGDPRALYADLLVRILCNTIYRDQGLIKGLVRDFDLERRRTGRDWPLVAHSMAGELRLQNVRNLVERTIKERVPGDYIETGVWRGGCCILMRGLIEAWGENRKVYVCDSFEGLPAPDPKYKYDAGTKYNEIDFLKVSLETVQENFRRYGLLDDQVVFVKGFFSNTLPTLQTGPLALLRLDGDMYESTIVALGELYPRLSKGGFVIIDDYILGKCKKAVTDFRQEHDITDPIEIVDATGVWWRKT